MPSRTTYQSTRRRRPRLRPVWAVVAPASAAPSLETTAEARVVVASTMPRRYQSRRLRRSRRPCRRPSARWAAPRVATTGTQSTGEVLPTRSTAAVAAVPFSSKTYVSSVAPTAHLEWADRRPATHLRHHHPRCHHRPAQSHPRHPVRLPRHPRPCSHTYAQTTRWWASHSAAARPPLRLEAATVILTTPRRGWWWASSSRTVP